MIDRRMVGILIQSALPIYSAILHPLHLSSSPYSVLQPVHNDDDDFVRRTIESWCLVFDVDEYVDEDERENDDDVGVGWGWRVGEEGEVGDVRVVMRKVERLEKR